jgi:hypothetical protein
MLRSLVESLFPDDLAGRVPEVRARHQTLGRTEAESWATLRDVFRAHEVRGEEPFADEEWIDVILSGRLAELGRLQFEDEGDGLLDVHIPETRQSLDPEACDASFARAREVFPSHHTMRCRSWLIDPQLADVLPESSNIVRFQRRFELHAETADGNEDVLRFVFHTAEPDLDRLTPRTTLERALVAHMRTGRSWHVRTGVTSLR